MNNLIYLVETWTSDSSEILELIKKNPNCVNDVEPKGSINYNSETDGYTALHFAAWDGKEDLIKLLIEKGSKVDTKGLDGYTPFLLAAGNGHYSSTVILVENGADINHIVNSDEDQRGSSGTSAIRTAAINQEWDVVDYLISKNAKLDTLLEPCLGKPGGYENLFDVIRYFGKTNEYVIHNEEKILELERLIK